MFDGCAIDEYLNNIPKAVMEAIVAVESSRNPYAIGVVGDRLVRQPKTLDEAVVTANKLEELGKNFSVGLAQLNKTNFARFNLKDVAQAFDRCTNLQAGASVLTECYQRSGSSIGKALSCYYSGNFVTGFEHGYVQRVIRTLESSPKSNTKNSQGLGGNAQPVIKSIQNISANFEKWATGPSSSPTAQPAQKPLSGKSDWVRSGNAPAQTASTDKAFVF
jgi:type IV secretion system protein VirB1